MGYFGPSTSRSTTTSPATTASAMPGTPRSRATPGRTGSTPWPDARGTRSATSGACSTRAAGTSVKGCRASAASPTRRSTSRCLHPPAAGRAVALVLARSGDAARGRRRLPRSRHINRDNFTYFDRKRSEPGDRGAGGAPIVTHDSFLDDAAKGSCRDVSWIDPNFIDLSVLDPNSNDDHPPSDVRAGQALVLERLRGAAQQPDLGGHDAGRRLRRARRLLRPRRAAPVQRGSGVPDARRCGCRRWWSGRGSGSSSATSTLEHTSLIATILRRFAANPEQAIAHDAPNASTAHRTWECCSRRARDGGIDHRSHCRRGDGRVAGQGGAARSGARAGPGEPSVETATAPATAASCIDFQEEFARFALAMRDAGLPPGQP